MANTPAADELAPVPWNLIEPHYRAGIRSKKAIAAEFGVSRTAIDKHAKKHGWTRDLRPAIQQQSDRQVAQVAVAPQVAPFKRVTDEDIVDAGAEQLTLIRLSHRNDIAHAREAGRRLMADFLEMSGSQAAELAAKLEGVLLDPDEPALNALREATALMASVPARAKVFKDIIDSLQRLVAMERDAYGLNTEEGGDRPTAVIKDYTGRGDPDNLRRNET